MNVVSDEVDQPLVLYHEGASGTARAAALPSTVNADSDSFLFRGIRFVRTSGGLVFWDYLTLPRNDIAGVVLVDFEVDTSLEQSRLLTTSSNVFRDEYGYHVRLTATDDELDVDGSQAFGCSLFENDEECVLLLPDWHRRGYLFSLDGGLIAP